MVDDTNTLNNKLLQTSIRVLVHQWRSLATSTSSSMKQGMSSIVLINPNCIKVSRDPVQGLLDIIVDPLDCCITSSSPPNHPLHSLPEHQPTRVLVLDLPSLFLCEVLCWFIPSNTNLVLIPKYMKIRRIKS